MSKNITNGNNLTAEEVIAESTKTKAPEQSTQNIVQNIRGLFPSEMKGPQSIDDVQFFICEVGRPSTISFPNNENYFLLQDRIIRVDESWMIEEDSLSLNRQQLNDLFDRLTEVLQKRKDSPSVNAQDQNFRLMEEAVKQAEDSLSLNREYLNDLYRSTEENLTKKINLSEKPRTSVQNAVHSLLQGDRFNEGNYL